MLVVIFNTVHPVGQQLNQLPAGPTKTLAQYVAAYVLMQERGIDPVTAPPIDFRYDQLTGDYADKLCICEQPG